MRKERRRTPPRGRSTRVNANNQTAEIERLLGLGAPGVHGQDYPKGADFVVLAGTDGQPHPRSRSRMIT